jgi:hypothetical protein
MSAYIKNTERSQVNDLMLHFKLLEKLANPKQAGKKIIKIRTKINEIEIKEAVQRIIETNSWFFEKINKIEKLLENLTKMRKEKTQISKIRNK